MMARYWSKPNPVGPPLPVAGMEYQLASETISTAQPGMAACAASASQLFVPKTMVSSMIRTRGGELVGTARRVPGPIKTPRSKTSHNGMGTARSARNAGERVRRYRNRDIINMAWLGFSSDSDSDSNSSSDSASDSDSGPTSWTTDGGQQRDF